MYQKPEIEGDLLIDTKEKIEFYHMPSIICLRPVAPLKLIKLENGRRVLLKMWGKYMQQI